MLKRYTFWLWVAVTLQLITCVVHSLSLFVAPVPGNPTEAQLLDLMTNYKMDMGAGIYRSFFDLFRALSSCFSLLCLLGGLTNIYLLKRKVEGGIIKGLVGIQVLVFGICLAMMSLFTFLPPIILTGLVFLTLTATYFTAPDRASTPS